MKTKQSYWCEGIWNNNPN